MKRFRALGVIGVVAIAVVLIGQGTASAILLQPLLTVTDLGGGGSITVTDNGPGDSDSRVGYITVTGMLGQWYINEYAVVNPGVSQTDPASLALTSDNTGTGKLDVTLTGSFNKTLQNVGGVVSAQSTLNNGIMNFATYVGTATDPLSFDHTNFNVQSALPNYYSGGQPYVVTLDYTLTSKGAGHDLVDNYSVNVVATPEPATLLLLGSGLVGLAGLGARRRR